LAPDDNGNLVVFGYIVSSTQTSTLTARHHRAGVTRTLA